MMEPTQTLAASQGTRSDAASSGVLCDSALDGLPEECDGLPESWYFRRPPAGSATLKPQGPDVPAASQDVQAPHDLAVTVLLQGEVAPKVLAAAPDEMAPNEMSAASASSADAGRGRGPSPSNLPPPRLPKTLPPGFLLPSSSFAIHTHKYFACCPVCRWPAQFHMFVALERQRQTAVLFFHVDSTSTDGFHDFETVHASVLPVAYHRSMTLSNWLVVARQNQWTDWF